MKRLKKLNEYNLQYDIGDIIKDFDISKLIMSRDSLYQSYNDVIRNNKESVSTGMPLGVWITDDNEFVLVDGYHRMIDLLFNGIKQADIEIDTVGYSDYWAYPNDKFDIDYSLKWNGLEDFCDDETLEDDYEEHYQK